MAKQEEVSIALYTIIPYTALFIGRSIYAAGELPVHGRTADCRVCDSEIRVATDSESGERSVEAKLARATRTEREREPRSAIENERAASLWLLPRAPGASLRNQNAPQYAERRQMIKLSTQ